MRIILNRKKIVQPDIWIFLLLAAFYLWMAAQIPYAHDDWDWGLDIGLRQLLGATLNGRYGGNFLVVVMTRWEILKTVIMGGCCLLIPALMTHVVIGEEKTHPLLTFLLSNLLLLTMAKEVWQQTYGWVAGFANYVISGIFLLIGISQLLRVFTSEPKWKKTPGRDALYGLSALLGQLFLENLSIYMVLAVLLAMVISHRRTGTLPKRLLWMAAGAVAGLLIMFRSEVYNLLWATGSAVDGARGLAISRGMGLAEIIYTLTGRFGLLLVEAGEGQTVLCLVSLALTAGNLLRTKRPFAAPPAGVNLALMVYFLLAGILNTGFGGTAPYLLVRMLLNFVYFLIVSLEIILLYAADRGKMFKLLFLWLSALAVLAPVAVTTTRGPRMYYISNIFIMLCVLNVAADMVRSLPDRCCRRLLQSGLVVILALALYYGGIYTAIGTCKAERARLTEEAVAGEQHMVMLPAFPHGDYLWYPEPQNDLRMEYFREFYGIPENTTVLFE